jgi:hypothetical protein
MVMSSIGSAQGFDDIPKGGAFLFQSKEEKCVGIKVADGDQHGMVVVPLKRGSIPELQQPDFRGLVFSIPKLEFVLSPFPYDISTDNEVNYKPGEIYLYGSDRQFLVIRHHDGRDLLLNIKSFEVDYNRDLANIPVIITRWALVVDLFNKPMTLCTYPATADRLTF